MLKKSISYLSLVFTLLISFSCSESSELKEESAGSFDRQLLLENVTDNIILPAFEDFTEKLVALEESITLFADTQNSVNLEEVQVSWFEAYKLWQHIEMFNISKAEEVFFMNKMNTYPASVSKIENNISTNQYDLDANNNNWVAQGFPTLDYLLFGLEDNNISTLLFYQNNDNAAHLNYLQAVVSQMVSITDIVSQDWNLSRDTFVNSTANSATSSLNMLTNDFIYYFEKGLRTNKFGIPAGVFSANNARVKKVEAYYKSTKSKELSLEALKAVKGFFKGEAYNSNVAGASLKSYLNYVTENEILSSAIITKFDESEQLMNNLDENYANQITMDNSLMINVFNKLQEGVVLLKTDLLSVLSISVDYIDADGD